MKDTEASSKAADIARKNTLKSLRRYGVTPGRVGKRLSEALDAKETKVFNDKDYGIVYSAPLVAHAARLKAIEIAVCLLDMKPAEKDINVNVREDEARINSGLAAVLVGSYHRRKG